MVVAPDIFRHLPGIFEVNGVNVHTDGKSLQGAVQNLCRHAADKGGIQTAREKKAHRCVRVQPFFNAPGQFVMDVFRDPVYVVMADMISFPDPPVFIQVDDRRFTLSFPGRSDHCVMTGREGHDPAADSHQTLRLR